MSANDKQIAGRHYKRGGVQHWDAVSALGIGYLEGCATKYLLRWRDKAGYTDLEKAEHFLEKLLEMVESGAITKNRAKLNGATLKRFYDDAKISYPESLIIDMTFRWKNAAHVRQTLAALRDFMAEQKCGPTPAYVDQG